LCDPKHDCIGLRFQLVTSVFMRLSQICHKQLPFWPRREALHCLTFISSRSSHLRPQQVLDGAGRGAAPWGLGTDSLPRGRLVLATVGFGNMCGGEVPPPNAMGIISLERPCDGWSRAHHGQAVRSCQAIHSTSKYPGAPSPPRVRMYEWVAPAPPPPAPYAVISAEYPGMCGPPPAWLPPAPPIP